MHVAIIGAGILGASVGYRLSETDAEIILIDAKQPASGTTSTSFAWVNANNKTPREYFELNYAGLKEHYRLREELAEEFLHPSGNLIWAEGDERHGELERRVERLRSWGYSAEWRRASEVNESLEPGVVFPTPDFPVAFFPEEAWADAPALAKCLVERARENGAKTRFGAAAEGVEVSDGGVCGVRLESGEMVVADAVVNAAGVGAGAVSASVGRSLPLSAPRGLLVRLAVEGTPLSRVMYSPRVNLRPDSPGFVLVHHESVDEEMGGEEIGMGHSLVRELLGRAREVVPALENAEVAEVKVGTRPVPEDGYPCVGAVPGVAGYYEAVTHSGVTLGPLIGRLLAREVLDGEVAPLLAPYRPGRF